MTIKELDAIRQKKKALIDVRRVVREQGEKLAKQTGYRKQVLVCGGTGCTSSHSMKVIAQLEQSLQELGIGDVLVVKTGCFGLCALGPIMIVYPEGGREDRQRAALSGHGRRGRLHHPLRGDPLL